MCRKKRCDKQSELDNPASPELEQSFDIATLPFTPDYPRLVRRDVFWPCETSQSQRSCILSEGF